MQALARPLASVPRSGIEKVAVVCNNCGAADAREVGRGRDHEYPHTSDDEFTMVRCACGLVYLNPRPSARELDTIYPADYYAYQLFRKRAASQRTGDSRLERFYRMRNARRFRPYASRLAALGRESYDLLDIGCGDGTTLDMWRDALEGRARTHGIEMSAEAAEVARARGHQVTSERIEDTDLPGAAFDAVYSFHVIEHVEDPTAFMRKVRQAVRPDGFALIETPNVDCLDFRLFGRRHWGGYHFPRHWTLYTPQTFARLAERTGFQIADITYYPAAVFWIWTMHSLLLGRAPGLADRLFPPVSIYTRGSLWNFGILTAFTLLDYAAMLATRRSSVMRLLLKPV
jgi:2-polyprenyl-3-methyl-5-hydroxy-6-metoxy-1,4-benzoquinol methylase